MALSTCPAPRSTAPPPTPFGYQPPEGATATAWICAEDCGTSGRDEDHQRWPRRCPGCGGALATHRLRSPWQHAAQRVEIDLRLHRPRHRGDLDDARAGDLVWHLHDWLQRGRPDLADGYRSQLDALIPRQEAANQDFDGTIHRCRAIQQARAHGAVELVGRELAAWYAAVRRDGVEAPARRGSCRQLVAQLLDYLEHPDTAQGPGAVRVWPMLRDLMPRIRSVVGTDALRRFDALRLRMTGDGLAEGGPLVVTLHRLRGEDDGTAPEAAPAGSGAQVRLPAQTPLRMAALGRFEFDPTGSGIDASLIWHVCLRPYVPHAVRPGGFVDELARLVLPVGGWSTFGAARCLRELAPRQESRPAFLAVLDTALEFLHGRGVPASRLRPVEWARWIEAHGPGSW